MRHVAVTICGTPQSPLGAPSVGQEVFHGQALCYIFPSQIGISYQLRLFNYFSCSNEVGIDISSSRVECRELPEFSATVKQLLHLHRWRQEGNCEVLFTALD